MTEARRQAQEAARRITSGACDSKGAGHKEATAGLAIAWAILDLACAIREGNKREEVA